jgi:hypothetical protein
VGNDGETNGATTATDTAHDQTTATGGPMLIAGLRIAEEIADQVCRRWPAEIMAVGAHGALAHRDDRGGTDVDIVVVTYRPDQGPTPTSRKIDGLIVDLGVISADQYLLHARTLSTRWPLAADQYLHTKVLYDESRWHERLRDTHLARLAEASVREFTALAREAWCTATSLHERAVKCTEWYDTDGALLLLGEARTAAAVTQGLLTRTYFRGSADATHQTGLAGADMVEVRERLRQQATELAKRGRPVDGEISDLFR